MVFRVVLGILMINRDGWFVFLIIVVCGVILGSGWKVFCCLMMM